MPELIKYIPVFNTEDYCTGKEVTVIERKPETKIIRSIIIDSEDDELSVKTLDDESSFSIKISDIIEDLYDIY